MTIPGYIYDHPEYMDPEIKMAIHEAMTEIIDEAEEADYGNGYIGAEITLRDSLMMNLDARPGYIAHAISQLRMTLLQKVSTMTAGIGDEHIVFKMEGPIAMRSPLHLFDEVRIGLRCKVFVAATDRVVIPQFVYEDIPGEENKIVEFRCGHCQVPNPIENRTCSQCGAPRALLIQELRQ